MTFRPDLQGLRALAVSLVVLAHAEVPGFAGGFIGVDVFFVLSGYLISAMLVTEHARSGRIAMARFYARRLRRLMPALLAMMTLTTAAAAWLLSQDEARAMLASTPFAASWTSNLFFALRTLDYFDELGTRDLFLHTWSLGVEEQFYLIWPPLLAGVLWLSTRAVRPLAALAALTLLGMLACVVWTQLAPIHAFYQMPARIWQFALGACVFFACGREHRHPGRQTPALALACGLSTIVASAMLFDSNTPYPGLHALAPSIGTALVIAAGTAVLRNPLADARLGWIGDRSYSIYLWHWPVLTLGAALGFDHRATETGGLLLLTLLLSMLSYRLIELPFWKGRLSHFAPRPVMLTGVLAITIAFAGSLHALWAPPSAERPKRDPARDIRLDMPVIYRMGCDRWISSATLSPCVFGEERATHTAMFIGDSVGAQWFSAFPEIYPAPQWRIVVHTKSACPIVDEDIFYKRIGRIYDVCREWREAALEEIVAQRPDVVVIGSANTRNLDARQWTDGSRRVFAQLSPHVGQVIVIAGTPKLGIDGPGCIVRARENAAFPLVRTCRGKPVDDLVHETIGHLREASRGFDNVAVIDPTELVCPKDSCSAITPDGTPVFRDHQHLTDTFARAATPRLRGAIEAATGPH